MGERSMPLTHFFLYFFSTLICDSCVRTEIVARIFNRYQRRAISSCSLHDRSAQRRKITAGVRVYAPSGSKKSAIEITVLLCTGNKTRGIQPNNQRNLQHNTSLLNSRCAVGEPQQKNIRTGRTFSFRDDVIIVKLRK